MLCWKDKYEYLVEIGADPEEIWDAYVNPGTCLLPEGHEGPHDFVPDSEILIEFD